MLRIAANISTLFTEEPWLARPQAAASAGFRAVEMQFPYEVPAADLAAACRAADIECVLINAPGGDLTAGELGLAGLPGREAEFAIAVDAAIAYAGTLKCPRINCLAGNVPAGTTRAACWPILVENIRAAARRAARAGVTILVEPMNVVDRPSFLLPTIEAADTLLDAVDERNVAIQYDIYHRAAAGEDWLGGIAPRLARIGHFQFSDYPGRHEPGTGTLDIPALLRLVASLPYGGWTGAEYYPSGTTRTSLGWHGGVGA